MSINIDDPFPVEARITPRENGYSANLPCASEWLTETEHGDVLQAAVDRARVEHGEDVTVLVKFHDDGFGVAEDYTILGKADEQADERGVSA